MMCRHVHSAAAVVIAIAGWPSLGAAQSQVALPSPLRLVDVVRIAGEASPRGTCPGRSSGPAVRDIPSASTAN
jgi:hypothetical protein